MKMIGRDFTDWKAEAERLKFDENKSWTEVADELSHYFPDLDKKANGRKS